MKKFTLIYINEICPLNYTDNTDEKTNKKYPYKSNDKKNIYHLDSYEKILNEMLYKDIGIHFVQGERENFILSKFISKSEIYTRALKNIIFKDEYEN